MCKVYTGYCGTSEIEHGLCACTVDNPLAFIFPYRRTNHALSLTLPPSSNWVDPYKKEFVPLHPLKRASLSREVVTGSHKSCFP